MKLFGRTFPTAWLEPLRAAFGSLKLRMTLAAIAALVLGIGLSTAMLLRQAERDTLAGHRHREMSDVVRTASALSRRIVELQRALQSTAARLDPETLLDADRLAAFMDAQPVLRALFVHLFAVSGDGRMRIFADAAGVRDPGLSVLDREYFRRTLAEQRAVVSEPLPGRVTGVPVIVLTAPLRADGKVHGLLGGALRLASGDLLDNLVEQLDLDGAVLTVVTDSRGRILAHPTRGRVLQSLEGEPRLSQAYAQWVAGGSPVEPAGLHLTQAGELASAAGVAGTEWMVWRAVPHAELLAPLRAARRQALTWAAALIGVGSLATLMLLWWLLRPLTQLEHRAQHLFDGSQDPHAGWPDAGGELGRLARVLRHVGAERAQLEAFNTGLLQKLGSVMSAAPVGIAFSREQRFQLVSAEFCHLFGRSEDELLGQPTKMMYACDADVDAVGVHVAKAFDAGQPYVGEWQMRRADGTSFWGSLRGRPVDAVDPSAGTIWTLNDIGEQIAARAQLEWSATHDVLTGLANRKVLDRRLVGLFGGMPRSVPAAIVMIDLDHFKPINDSSGHAAGDAVLKAVAVAIASQVRGSDLVVRIGGDEFVLLLERCAPGVAMRIAENVRGAIAEIALPWAGQILSVGSSVGLAALTVETRDAAAWLAAADAACYAAKADGRGKVRAAARPARVTGTVIAGGE